MKAKTSHEARPSVTTRKVKAKNEGLSFIGLGGVMR
jgi:hypothetical protein